MRNIEPLFQKYRDDIYRLALSYTRNPQEAEDACQTVFLKLMEQENFLDPETEMCYPWVESVWEELDVPWPMPGT